LFRVSRPAIPWCQVNWYGQLGSDQGRDIVVTCSDGPLLIVQCANLIRLSYDKISADLRKLARFAAGAPADFRVICGGTVSAKLKSRITAAAQAVGFQAVSVWSGPEFEEQLRTQAPELLHRFVSGILFPELPQELAAASRLAADVTDSEIITALALSLDRPAFRTHFHQESSLPRFKEAIAETIQTLNTGKTPQGSHIPSRHQVRNPAHRAILERIVGGLVSLRAAFDNFLRSGEIKPCGCQQPECPVFFFEHGAARKMDDLREEILLLVHQLDSTFSPHFY
jgi:hypothetical protein